MSHLLKKIDTHTTCVVRQRGRYNYYDQTYVRLRSRFGLSRRSDNERTIKSWYGSRSITNFAQVLLPCSPSQCLMLRHFWCHRPVCEYHFFPDCQLHQARSEHPHQMFRLRILEVSAMLDQYLRGSERLQDESPCQKQKSKTF
jgi:hypothetical protein